MGTFPEENLRREVEISGAPFVVCSRQKRNSGANHIHADYSKSSVNVVDRVFDFK